MREGYGAPAGDIGGLSLALPARGAGR
jgi:hypothetical protein